MTCTFYLKEPKSDKESIILFSCHFKKEGKKFVYSTGERINPKYWDQKERQPISRGKNKSPNSGSIKVQIARYEDHFKFIRGRCIETREDFTSQILKKSFDEEFKKTPTGKNLFFDAYEEFIIQNTKEQIWKPSTLKRYRNIKNILVEFQKEKNFKLNFNSINGSFYSEFTDFCLGVKGHINNTYSRNIGLFKTFMFWAIDKGYTYNEDFKKFRKKERVITNQIALKKEDLQILMKKEFNSKRLERVRDVFVFSCVTGLRFGELKWISKNNIIDGSLHLKEEKGAEKEIRTIPLNDFAMFILRKYDFDLPLIANQKHNDYIKEVFKESGYTSTVEKVTTRGKEVIRETMPFYDRISTHTARRTFITLMKREGKSDKLISKITGHKDMKTLNQYYQVDDEAKREAVNDVFNIEIPLVRKVD